MTQQVARLYAWIRDNHISIMELSRMTNIHVNTLNRWFYLDTVPTQPFEEKIEQILNAPVSDLYVGDFLRVKVLEKMNAENISYATLSAYVGSSTQYIKRFVEGETVINKTPLNERIIKWVKGESLWNEEDIYES